MTENSVFGDSVTKFKPTGYTFMSSLEKSHHFSQNLLKDARHSASIRELEKKSTVQQDHLDLGSALSQKFMSCNKRCSSTSAVMQTLNINHSNQIVSKRFNNYIIMSLQ
jgi:hypothetical protein